MAGAVSALVEGFVSVGRAPAVSVAGRVVAPSLALSPGLPPSSSAKSAPAASAPSGLSAGCQTSSYPLTPAKPSIRPASPADFTFAAAFGSFSGGAAGAFLVCGIDDHGGRRLDGSSVRCRSSSRRSGSALWSRASSMMPLMARRGCRVLVEDRGAAASSGVQLR